MNLKDLSSFDWRSLQKYFSPKATEDLNTFLESLPQNAGQLPLMIAGTVWSAVILIGLYTFIQLGTLTELRAELQEVNALKPAVPRVIDVAVDSKDLNIFVQKAQKIYTGIEMKAGRDAIQISAAATSDFGQFREAIGHVNNGGSGWRVSVDKLCVGRECDKVPLFASLKISKVSVDKPG